MTHTTPYILTTDNILQAIDARYYQFIIQISLLIWGVFYLDILIHPMHLVVTLFAGSITQFIFTRHLRLPFNMLSTINSMMSILILLHASSWVWMALAGIIAVSSKYLIRYKDNHIFNPSNIGIIAVLLLVPETWANPGQWGQAMWITLFLSGLGLVLLLSITQMLASISFIALFVSLTFIHAYWLGDPIALPLHQLQSGAVLIFAFFMLSDPMTTPKNPLGRVIFGSWIGFISWFLQYQLYIPNAFLYALALSMPLVLLLNHVLVGNTYQWPKGQRLG